MRKINNARGSAIVSCVIASMLLFGLMLWHIPWSQMRQRAQVQLLANERPLNYANPGPRHPTGRATQRPRP